MSRRLALALIAVVILVATGVMLAAQRFHRAGDDLFMAGESAYANYQYADAVKAFSQLSREFPDHPRADDALYKLGWINRTRLDLSEPALAAFSQLVEQHPDSPYALRALDEMAAIYRSEQHYDDAIRTYEAIVFELKPDDAHKLASAHLGLAHTYFEMADSENAAKACEIVLNLPAPAHSSLSVPKLEALRLLADIALDLDDDLEAAAGYLERIVNEYPGLPGSEEAQKDIVWVRQRMAGAAGERPGPGAPERADEPGGGRRLGPASGTAVVVQLGRDLQGEEVRDEGLFECIRVLCAARGIDVTAGVAAGCAAEPFAFFYSSAERLRGDRVHLDDPVILAAKRLGVSSVEHVATNNETEALTKLKHFLHGNTAVLVPMTMHGRPTWRVVTGYDPQRGEFYLFSATEKYSVMDGKEFRGAWGRKSSPAIRVEGRDAAMYHIYALNGAIKKVDAAQAAKNAIAEAETLLRGAAAGDFVSGAEAFEELAKDFGRFVDGALDATDERELTDWCGRPLDDLEARRRRAAECLRAWRDGALSDAADASELGEAADLLDDSADALDALGRSFASAREGTGPREGGGSPRALAQRLAEQDVLIADALSQAL